MQYFKLCPSLAVARCSSSPTALLSRFCVMMIGENHYSSFSLDNARMQLARGGGMFEYLGGPVLMWRA